MVLKIMFSILIIYYSINMLSNHLETKIHQQDILKPSFSPFKMFIIGIAITFITQSSTAITAITISLLSSKVISLKSGFSLILGSNIGTSFTSLITGLNSINYPIIFIIGFLLTLNKKRSDLGKGFIYISFLFMGINNLKLSLLSLENTINIIKYFNFFNKSNVCSFIGGTIITFIFQSSSTIIAITQQMCSSKLLSLVSGLSIVLGANVGTTFSGIILSLNKNLETKVLSIANLFVNLIFGLFFLVLFSVLNIYIKSHESMYIGIFQVLFNIFSSVLGFIFIDWFIKIGYIFINKKTV